MTTLSLNADASHARLSGTAFAVPDIGAYVVSLLARRYWMAAGLVLLLSACNLTFRLGHEIVVEWDESLYGLSAWEMFNSHQWIGTTFRGSLDYYNTKPPLNVWLICLSFKVFGANLIALRLPSILSAWLTVAVLQLWVRRAVGPAMAVMSSLVLGTAFGFLYDHAGRNANTDPLFALLVLLTVVTLWSASERTSRLIWIGPIAAATFLLRGMGVLMPLAIVGMVEMARRDPSRKRVRPALLAVALFAIPVAAWMFARWRLDQWRFLGPLFLYDFVARSLKVLEGHPGTPFYHLNALQKNVTSWLVGGAVALLLFPIPWSRLRNWFTFWRGGDPFKLVVGSWVVITLLMPTLIRTKLSWYLNPFYPAFALGTAAVFIHGLKQMDRAPVSLRIALVTLFTLTLAAAETRLVWYSVHRRDLAQSTQGFLIADRRPLSGHGVFRTHWDNSELFVLNAIVGAEAREIGSVDDFLLHSVKGDFWLARTELTSPSLSLVQSRTRYWLYRRDH